MPDIHDYRMDRHAVRQLLRGSRSMDYADWSLRMGLINARVHARYVRIFAWATATEHRLTRAASLPHWRARRDRVRRAIAPFARGRA